MPKPHTVGHILLVKGADSVRDRAVFEIAGVRTIVVVVPEPEHAPVMAAWLVEEEGASLIELDGGLGPKWTAKVVEAVKGVVPVGAVMFGAESLISAAAFIKRYNA
jgi:hypothetical protein